MLLADEISRYQEEISRLTTEKAIDQKAKEELFKPTESAFTEYREQYSLAKETHSSELHEILAVFDNQIKHHKGRIEQIIARLNTRPRDASFFFWLDNSLDFTMMFESLMAPVEGQQIIVYRGHSGRGYRGTEYGKAFTFFLTRHSRIKNLFYWKKGATLTEGGSTSAGNALAKAVREASTRGLPLLGGIKHNQRLEPVSVTDVAICIPKPTQEYEYDADAGVSTRYLRHYPMFVTTKELAIQAESAYSSYNYRSVIYPSGFVEPRR